MEDGKAERLTQDDIINYRKGKIATFKILRYVIFVEEYPRGASGKIKQVELKEMPQEKL